MIKVTMKPTVDFEDITNELGVHLGDCNFTEMAENGSYVSLDCSDKAVKELKESIEWATNRNDSRYCRKLQNDLYVINELRHMGYKDSILVYIFW